MLYAFFDDFQFSLFEFLHLSSFNACEELDHVIIWYPPVPRTHEYWGTLSPSINGGAALGQKLRPATSGGARILEQVGPTAGPEVIW